MRLCVGSRRGFIIRMRLGSMPIDPLTRGRAARVMQQKTFGRANDGNNYCVVHVTGYLKNWPPAGNLCLSGKTFLFYSMMIQISSTLK